MKSHRSIRKGFTLVEILIVVIILGILAAIVIPQFTNASEDARKSSLSSQLQTLRSQVELYKLQHRERFPTTDGTADATKWDWTLLTGKTTEDGAAGGTLGPYLQTAMKNSLNNSSTVAATAAAGVGFTFDTNGKVGGVNKDGTAYAE